MVAGGYKVDVKNNYFNITNYGDKRKNTKERMKNV